MQLVCSKNHPLAAKPQVYWTDLHDQDLILFDRNDAPHFHELIARHLLHNNITPRVRQELSQIHTVVSLVRENIGVAIAPASAAFLDRENVVFRPITSDEAITVELYIAWRKDNRNPLVHRVLDIARAI